MCDVRRLCNILNVSRKGYYQYIRKSNRTLENEVLIEKIKDLYYQNKGVYGSPRIAIALNNIDIFTSKNRVARHMRNMNLQAKTYKRKRNSYRRIEKSLISDNLINQCFVTKSKNQVWLGDITYIPVVNKNIYLASFIDVFTRKIVGWTISNRINEQLVISAFEKAIVNEKPSIGLIVHTDRGSQYTSKNYQALLLKYGAISSMSRPGNPFDNALMESFYKSLKSELLINGKFENTQKAKNAVFEYIEMFYNTKRLHSSLGYMSPIEFENKI